MIIRLFFVMLFVGFNGIAAGKISAIDDERHVLVLDQAARRIVTLSPSLAEIVFAVGAGDRLVGVSSYSDFPAAASKVQVVASSGRIDIERLRSLRPDLVIGWLSGNPRRDIDRLKRERMPVFMTEPRRLADIASIVRSIGTLAGTPGTAEAAARSFEEAIAALSVATNKTNALVPTFVEIWHRPMLTVSGAHLITDILRVCGATNVFEGIPMLTARVSAEQLLVANPSLLIVSGLNEQRTAIVNRWRAFQLLRAVQHDNIAVIDPRTLHRQGVRIVEGVRGVCAAVREVRPS